MPILASSEEEGRQVLICRKKGMETLNQMCVVGGCSRCTREGLWKALINDYEIVLPCFDVSPVCEVTHPPALYSIPIPCLVEVRRSPPPQVILVGDFNIAMSQKDVHTSIQFQGLYTHEELSIMKVAAGWGGVLLFGPSQCNARALHFSLLDLYES